MLLLSPRDSRAEKYLPITLITVGMNYSQEPCNRPAGVEYHQILYVERGRGVLETLEGKYDIEEGTAIFMRANTPAHYYAKDSVFDTAWITFIGNGVGKMLECFGAKDFAFLKSDSVYTKITNVFKMVERRKNAELLSKYAYDILVTFFSELALAKKPPLLVKTKEFIDENFSSPISAQDIAASVGISESLLFKLFREHEDVTPTEYLRNVRLQKAEQMLLSNADVRVSDVARRCGFADSAYFCKVFKDEMGMTPKNYQNKYIKLGDVFMEDQALGSVFEYEKKKIKNVSFFDRKIGYFERREKVLMEIAFFEKRIESYAYTIEITDGWGEVFLTRRTVAERGCDRCIVDLGHFPIGWYRITLQSESGEVFNDYFAFAVTVNLSERCELEDTTLATDVAAEYEPKTMELGDEFVRSLKLLGFPWLRGRTNMTKWGEQVTEYRERLKAAGFKVTSASTDDMYNLPKIREMDLRDTYQKYKDAPAKNAITNEMYEIQNEADLFFSHPPLPDTHTAYCKAAFIGLLDSGVDAFTSMTSTAFCADTIYYDLTLQNGVLDYSNIYNFHGYEGIESKAAYARKSVLAYSPENSIRPSYMTENGKKVWAGGDGVALFDQLQSMCRYAVKSCAKILAEGSEKWFWFISRAFLEAGGGFGNAHAWTQQPYPIAAVTANLTYQLGKGKYKGKISDMPEKAHGYLFDRGVEDVAIIFGTERQTITFKSNKLIVADMFGKETELVSDSERITVEITGDPIFVRFCGRIDGDSYYKTSFDLLECKKLEFSEEQRVVLNPVWEDQDLSRAIIMQKGYLFNEKDEQRVTLRIYNFNDHTVDGRAYVVAEYPDHFDIEIKSSEFTLEPFGRKDIDIVIRTTGRAKMNSMGDILFGADLSNGRKVSSAVARYWFKLDDMQLPAEDIKAFDGFLDEKNWNLKNIMHPGKMSFEKNGDEITLKADHGGGYAQWYFPEFFVKDAEIFEGADGIVLRRKHSHNVKTKLTAFICTEDGRSYWSGDASGVAYTDEWKTIVYPWDTFILFSSPEGFNDPRPFDPKKIYKVRIGASGTPSECIPDTTIKDFGIFYDNMGATKPHPNSIEFNGVEEGMKYDSAEGLKLIATLPEDADGNIRVFLGKTAYTNYSVDGNKVVVDLSSLGRGEYTLQVSCRTKVNYMYSKYVTFYVKNDLEV